MNKFSKIIKDIKARISNYGSKKIIEKAVIIAIVGVICLIAGSVLFEDNQKKTENTAAAAVVTSANSNSVKPGEIETMKQANGDAKSEMEENLRAILSQIKGAGRVDVMITFVSGNESVPAVDVNTNQSTTQEKDKEGGSRDIKENSKDNSIVYEESQGMKKPFVIKEILPKVKGVVIVAEGAGDIEVKSNLAKAAEALLEVAPHKIEVFQRRIN